MNKFISVLMILLCSACGFRPVFSGQDADIYVAPIAGINGIDLRNALNTKFNGQNESDSEYKLTVTLNQPVTVYKALEPTGDASWRQVTIKANYTLSHKGKEIISGTQAASESYTFVRYLVAANASYNNAVQNIIRILADEIGTISVAEIQKFESDKETNKK